MEHDFSYQIAENGGHRYENGSTYVGPWNSNGRPEGEGHILFEAGIRYDGNFHNGLFHGVGVLSFPDGAKYEGEFMSGWFHGHGIFWRADGMKHEGEFRGGKIWGLGQTTFKDGSNGFPRCEGFFKECQLLRKKNCQDHVQRAQKIAFSARAQSCSD